MGYLVYGFVRVVEATLLYLLAYFVLGYLDTKIPPLGSGPYIVFVVIWPFVAPILYPGLRTIPIIGDAFSLLDALARSGLAPPEGGMDEAPGKPEGAKNDESDTQDE